MKRTKLLVLMLILSAVLLTSCGGPVSISRPPVEGTPQSVSGRVVAKKIAPDKIKVSCSTNLMNGSILKVSLDAFDGTELAEVVYNKTCDVFYAEFTIDPKWSNKIYASLVCQPDANGSQSKEVFEAYGKRFSNMQGEDVLYDQNGNMLVCISELIEL